MSLTNTNLLPVIYHGLATPAPSRPVSPDMRPNRGPFDATTPSAGALSDALQSAVDARGIATDSLSRTKTGQLPVLEHILSVGQGKALCLAADDDFIYAGVHSKENEINVFSRTSFQLVHKLYGHEGSVLALLLVAEKAWLISASSDGSVRIWCTKGRQCLTSILPSHRSCGDVYSLAWDPRGPGTLYMGCQSTDIQHVNFDLAKRPAPICAPHPEYTGSRINRIDVARFFEGTTISRSAASSPALEKQMASQANGHANGHERSRTIDSASPKPDSGLPATIEVGYDEVEAGAHYGYIYCMEIVDRPGGEKWLVSGSGASDLKIWRCLEDGGLQLLTTFEDLPGAVLSLVYRDSLLFAGLQGGHIKVWDLETRSCVRTILAQRDDVMTMAIFGQDLYTVAADGIVMRFNESFDCSGTFQAHAGAVFSSLAAKDAAQQPLYLTAGDDSRIKIWSLPGIDNVQVGAPSPTQQMSKEGDIMLYALAKLIAVPTISDSAHREQCRQGAHLLRRILMQLGAQARLISAGEGRNPIIVATFAGVKSSTPRKRLLFYGHYDVQPVDKKLWDSDPFTLAGRDGYLYGRGVADDKGPIVAMACAVAALRDQRILDVDVVMLIEGEEEAGSGGFQETVIANKEDIGHIDCILLSNSSWIGESDPCIVYGMRGVIYAQLGVSSKRKDAHSGVDGGSVDEPMSAMIRLLGSIGSLTLPGFFDDIQAESPEEVKNYEEVAATASTTPKALARKWAQPTFSVANIMTTAQGNNTIIPRQVTANVSFRLVPDQDVDKIAQTFVDFCKDTFASFETDMVLDVDVPHRASWWLASLENACFKRMEHAIQAVWGKKPLRIREGGASAHPFALKLGPDWIQPQSIPSIPFLEKLFGAPCVHLPLGQHSSAAHLSNERLGLLNLRNGQRVMEEFLLRMGDP